MTVTIESATLAPAGWDQWLDGVADATFAATRWWNATAARHYPQARERWWLAHRSGELVGGLVALQRRHRGLDRLESGLEGSPAGPQLDGRLTAPERTATGRALVAAAGQSARGRVAAVSITFNGAASRSMVPAGWTLTEVPTAVVDLAGGLAQVERHVLSNNRRNERNRGLKRGCTLHTSHDAADLAAWYPLYLEVAASWAQAPVPLGFMQDLVREQPRHAFFTHVRHGEQIIGGHFCMAWRDHVHALYGASRSDRARDLFPATLLYWQDIVEACARGARWLDFGGYAGRSGLQRFKQLMGAGEEVRLQATRWHPLWGPVAAVRRRLRGGT